MRRGHGHRGRRGRCRWCGVRVALGQGVEGLEAADEAPVLWGLRTGRGLEAQQLVGGDVEEAGEDDDGVLPVSVRELEPG